MTVASQVKQTIATLKGIESTLELYSIKSHNEDEKSTYRNSLERTNDIIDDLEKRLKDLEYEEPQYKGF
ncbi:uncharacterized protein DUF1657 [Orenia metallireducens]|jgi:seryl-tRNA(Sec) selenium transferase|uniref:DUF1657 domain-containing protein n=1 Tax=Orenia metallireducens TaxID=1413210 RepID=A0A285GSN0_9FIRM|nr:DUF1657 domain-containing protein [Orenia metallireducens]PRX32622.1 uncharacterized protein DUF1657 [Orenia metallireducens]SNY26527.1 Protein of unknown function [Orenia metallireducens]